MSGGPEPGKTGANKDDIVDLCAKVAEAGGGLMSFRAKTTDAERGLIRDIASALGEGARWDYCPSGVVTSVPAGGLNSNVDGGIGARVWLE